MPSWGNVGGCANIMESVYSTLFLGFQKSRKFRIVVKTVVGGRCLVDMYIPFTLAVVCQSVTFYTYRREASARLLVLLRWTMREPLKAGRANGMALTLLFYHMPVCEPRHILVSGCNGDRKKDKGGIRSTAEDSHHQLVCRTVELQPLQHIRHLQSPYD